MLPCNCAAAHGVYTDFLLSFPYKTVPSVYLPVCMLPVHGSYQHFGGTAWRVLLLVMVLFHNLHIKAFLQHRCNHLQNLLKNCDSKREICLKYNRCHTAQLFHLALLNIIMPGGAADIGTCMLQYKRLDPDQIVRMRKVNDDIHMLLQGGYIRMIGTVGNHNDLHIVALLNGFHNHFTHIPIACNKYI